MEVLHWSGVSVKPLPTVHFPGLSSVLKAATAAEDMQMLHSVT